MGYRSVRLTSDMTVRCSRKGLGSLDTVAEESGEGVGKQLLELSVNFPPFPLPPLAPPPSPSPPTLLHERFRPLRSSHKYSCPPLRATPLLPRIVPTLSGVLLYAGRPY
eukprot:757023-Hanusia_phi.AAC.2